MLQHANRLLNWATASLVVATMFGTSSANTFDITTLTSGKTITIVEAEQNYDVSGQGPANPIALGLNTVPFDGVDRQITFDGQTAGWNQSDVWGGFSSWNAGGLLDDGTWHSDRLNGHGNNAPRITTTIDGIAPKLYEVYVAYVSDVTRANGGGMIMARQHDPTDTAAMPTYGSEYNSLGLVRGEDTNVTVASGSENWNLQVALLGIVNGTTLSIDVDNDPRTIGAASRSQYVGIGYRESTTPFIQASIDRDTGVLTFSNNGGGAATILGYSFTSAVGALDQSKWDSIAETGDLDSGDMDIDPDDKWTKLTAAGVATDLSESQIGGPGPANGATLASLSSLTLGDVWIKTPDEDVMLEVLLPGGTEMVPVQFTGNGDASFQVGDLNFQDGVTEADWIIYRDNFMNVSGSLSPAQSYMLGDMDGDGDNDWDDFDLFKAVYNEANGPGSFQAMVNGVPEPGTALLLGLLAPAAVFVLRAKKRAAEQITEDFPQPTDKAIFKMPQHTNTLLIWATACLVVATTVGSASANTFDITTLTSGKTITIVEADKIYDEFGQGPADPIAQGLNTVPFDGVDRQIAFNGQVAGYTQSDKWGGFGTWNAGGLLEGTWYSSHLNGHGNNAPRITTTIEGLDPKLYEVYVAYVSDVTRSNGGGMVMARQHDPTDTATMTTYGSEYNSLGLVRGEDTNITAASGSENWNLQVASLGLVNDTTLSIDVDNDPRSIGAASRSLYVGIGYRAVPQLTLEVNTTTGMLSIANDSGATIEIEGYEISSQAGSLNFGNWNSLQDQDYEGSGAPGNGMGFEELGTPNPNSLNEAILTATYTFAENESANLGNVFSLGTQDLSFRFKGADGTFFPGIITEVTSTPVLGDYNGDGTVNIADYTVWRNNLGASDESAFATGTGNGGGIDANDYTNWKANFGNPAASGTFEAAAVPEPATATLVLCGLVGTLGVARRRSLGGVSPYSAVFRTGAVLIVAWVVVGSTALATVFNDREYRMGDSGDGTTPGEGVTVSGTWDDAGTPNEDDLIDLEEALGDPSYTSVAGRPLAGGSTWGIAFDGDDLLYGFPVNRPDEMKSIIDAESSRTFPNNYTGILGHGLQMWVRPDAAALGSPGNPTTFQSIVADTQNSGGPAINAIGQWTQTNSGHNDGSANDTVVPASVAVPAGDAWYHVMHHHHPVSGSTFTSVVYVDGVAVSANLDTISTGSAFSLSVGARQVSGNRVTPVFGNHFTGVVDDLNMYVFGNNETGTPGNLGDGEDYGTFNLFEDNEWIKNAIDTHPDLMGTLLTGDINRDGEVSGDGTGPVGSDDVSAFVAGWLSENVFQTPHSGPITVGDWNTWGLGDLNLDGRTSLADALILHNELLANGSVSGLDFGLLSGGTTVPEPTALTLLGLATVCSILLRRRSRG